MHSSRLYVIELMFLFVDVVSVVLCVCVLCDLYVFMFSSVSSSFSLVIGDL